MSIEAKELEILVKNIKKLDIKEASGYPALYLSEIFDYAPTIIAESIELSSEINLHSIIDIPNTNNFEDKSIDMFTEKLSTHPKEIYDFLSQL